METTGPDVSVTWSGRRIHAFVPGLLADRDLTLDAALRARTGAAASELAHSAEALDADYESLAWLLLRTEGVASSSIERVTAPVVNMVLAEKHLDA